MARGRKGRGRASEFITEIYDNRRPSHSFAFCMCAIYTFAHPAAARRISTISADDARSLKLSRSFVSRRYGQTCDLIMGALRVIYARAPSRTLIHLIIAKTPVKCAQRGHAVSTRYF